MAGYTKADFDAAYDINAEPNGHPHTRPGVRLHYNRAVLYDYVVEHWENLVPMLGITNTDRVLVVGAAFGWGVEALIDLVGCEAVGIDTSDYVQNVKDADETDDIDAAITAAGLDPLTGEGAQIRSNLNRGQRKRADVVVLQEDLSNNGSRNRVKREFNDLDPTWIVTEEMVSEFTDQEITQFANYIANFPSTSICHFFTEDGANTLEHVNTLTGHTCITPMGWRRVD